MPVNYAYDMIRRLRESEEILMYNNILTIAEEDRNKTVLFLEDEYKKECYGYPYTAPPFDKEAAFWAAKTIYTAAQLLLYREHKSTELSSLFESIVVNPNPSQFISADLCMRFLPAILNQLKLIDGEDELIKLLEEKLVVWHFSGVSYPMETEKINFETITQNACLYQLYTDRIILNKKLALAKHPAFESHIAANLGMYAEELWKEFKTELL